MATLPKSYVPAAGGGYHFDMGDGGAPLFASGPEADAMAAQLYSQQPAQIDPSIATAATNNGPDMRTADASDAIKASLGAGASPSGIQIGSASTIDPRIAAAQARADAASGGPVGSDADKVRGALGVGAGPGIFDAVKPTDPRLVKAQIDAVNAATQAGAAPSIRPTSPQSASAYPPGVIGYRKQGAYVPVTKVTEGPAPVSKETVDALKEDQQTQKNAIESGAEMGKHLADHEYGARVAYQDQMKDLELTHAARQKMQEDDVSNAVQNAKDTAQAAREGKIDSSQVWNDMNPVAAGIAMVLGGIQGWASGTNHNQMMDQFNKIIDRNYEKQRAELANKRESAKEAQNLVGMVRQQHADSESQYLSAKGAMLQSLMGELETEASKYKGTQAEINAQNAIGQLNKEFDMTMAHFQQQTTEKVQSHYLPPGPIAGPGLNPKVASEAKELAKYEDEKGIIPGQAELEPLNRVINKYKGADTIPGYGVTADLKAGVPLIGKRVLMNDEERENRGAIERAEQHYVKSIASARGISNEDARAVVSGAFEGAKTPKELAEVAHDLNRELEVRRKSVEAGFDPRAVDYLEQRGAYKPANPPPSLRRIGP